MPVLSTETTSVAVTPATGGSPGRVRLGDSRDAVLRSVGQPQSTRSIQEKNDTRPAHVYLSHEGNGQFGYAMFVLERR